MNSSQNNRIVGLAIGALLLIASYRADWLTLSPDDLVSAGSLGRSLPFGMAIAVTGTTGTVAVLGISVPLWLAISAGLLSLVLIALNVRGITSLPVGGLAVPWVLSMGVVVMVIGHAMSRHTSIGIGPILAAAGLVSGLLSARRSPRTPNYQR